MIIIALIFCVTVFFIINSLPSKKKPLPASIDSTPIIEDTTKKEAEKKYLKRIFWLQIVFFVLDLILTIGNKLEFYLNHVRVSWCYSHYEVLGTLSYFTIIALIALTGIGFGVKKHVKNKDLYYDDIFTIRIISFILLIYLIITLCFSFDCALKSFA